MWDWDKNPAKHEIIGSGELTLPDLNRLLFGGGASAALDAVTLYDATAKPSSSLKSSGTISGSISIKTN